MVKPARRYMLLTLLLSAVAMAHTGRAAEPVEDDYYRIISIVTSKSPTESRAKHWKPAPSDLVLEVSGLAVLDGADEVAFIRDWYKKMGVPE